MGKVLEIIDLSYKGFKSFNMSFNDKSFYSVIGSNNCGKTTLFKLISGILPSNDNIFYKNISLNRRNINNYIVNFGIVDRVNSNSFIYNYVFDEMMYPLHNLDFSENKSIDRIKEVLNIFQEDGLINKEINKLNYYDKQLLLIMIALLHKPKVLLLDSVLEVFPKELRDKIIKILKNFSNDGMLIINFTNSLEEASLSDKIILLDEFKLVGEYTKDDIYNDDKLFYEHNLEIPFLIDLSVKLKMYDLVDKKYINMRAMVDDIWP